MNSMNYQKKVKAISTKESTKDLINKLSTLKCAKHFSVGIFQNYLVYLPAKNNLNTLVALLELNHGNLMEFQTKILKI